MCWTANKFCTSRPPLSPMKVNIRNVSFYLDSHGGAHTFKFKRLLAPNPEHFFFLHFPFAKLCKTLVRLRIHRSSKYGLNFLLMWWLQWNPILCIGLHDFCFLISANKVIFLSCIYWTIPLHQIILSIVHCGMQKSGWLSTCAETWTGKVQWSVRGHKHHQ